MGLRKQLKLTKVVTNNMESTTTAVVSSTALVIQYPNILIALAAIGAFAIIEHMFMAGRWYEARKKK